MQKSLKITLGFPAKKPQYNKDARICQHLGLPQYSQFVERLFATMYVLKLKLSSICV